MLAEADQSPRTALPGKILVIDDEQRILRFVVRGLRAEGFAVDAADNGADGLNKALEAASTWSSWTCSCREWTARRCCAGWWPSAPPRPCWSCRA
jgi:hypothetical protein